MRLPWGHEMTDDVLPRTGSSGDGAISIPAAPVARSTGYIRQVDGGSCALPPVVAQRGMGGAFRSEEHTSELQSLMRISYAVFCLKKKNKTATRSTIKNQTRE